MSIVLTNWNAAFQKERGTWFLTVYAVFAFVLGSIAWVRGSFAARIIDHLARDFFCLQGPAGPSCVCKGRLWPSRCSSGLPGYRESLRALTFSGAIVFGVAWSLFSMHFSQPATTGEMGLNLAGSFLMGGAFYLVLTTLRLILSRRVSAFLRLATIPLVLVATLVDSEARAAPFAIWPILMPVFVALCGFVWIRLGDMECVKRGQRIILADAIERGPVPESPRTTLPRVEKWLKSQMERQGYLHAGRYVWGELYAAIGRLLHYWKWVLGSLLGCAWILGDMGPSAANVVFAASGSLACMPRSPVLSPLVLPGGRKERRQAALGAVAATSLLLMAAASAIVVLSWLLSPFLGGAPSEGREASYAGLQPYGVLLPCVLAPWFSAFGLLGFRPRSLGELAVTMVVVAMTIVLVAMLAEISFTLAVPIWSIWMQPIAAAGVFVGGWLFLLLVLRVVSIRWDLVDQPPTQDD